MRRTIGAVIGLAALSAACATHAPSSPPPPPQAPSAAAAPLATHSVVLTQAHIELVRAYYGNHHAGPGNGRGGLPPGIAKNLQRGKPLPPGIARQYLPAELHARLPVPPKGFEYVIVAGKLLLVEIATQVVRQVLLEAIFA